MVCSHLYFLFSLRGVPPAKTPPRPNTRDRSCLEPARLNLGVVVGQRSRIIVNRFPSEILFGLADVEVVALGLLRLLRSVNNRHGFLRRPENSRKRQNFFLVRPPHP